MTAPGPEKSARGWRTGDGPAFLAVTGGLAALALFGAGLAPSAAHAALAAAAIWAGLLAYFLDRRLGHPSTYRVYAASGALLAASYGAPVFLASYLAPRGEAVRFYGLSFTDTAALFALPAVALALAGILAFVLVFYVVRRRARRLVPRFRLPAFEPGPRLYVLTWGLLLVYLAYLYLPVLRSLPSIGQFAQPVGYLAFALFLDLALRRRLPPVQGLAVFGIAFPLVIAKLLSGGQTAPILLYNLYAFFVVWNVGERLPVKTMIGAVLVFFLFYNSAQVYRTYAWSGGPYEHASTVEKIRVLAGVVAYNLTGRNPLGIESIEGSRRYRILSHDVQLSQIQRLSHIVHVTRAMAVTPDDIPYWDGSSYRPLLTSSIPRALWPDKPRETRGEEFANRYWLDNNPSMSMNLPWLPELYLNFGPPGVVVGMAVFGLLFALLDRAFNAARASREEAIVGLAVLMPFVYPESNFSLMTGSMLLLVIALWIYFRLGHAVLGRLDRS